MMGQPGVPAGVSASPTNRADGYEKSSLLPSATTQPVGHGPSAPARRQLGSFAASGTRRHLDLAASCATGIHAVLPGLTLRTAAPLSFRSHSAPPEAKQLGVQKAPRPFLYPRSLWGGSSCPGGLRLAGWMRCLRWGLGLRKSEEGEGGKENLPGETTCLCSELRGAPAVEGCGDGGLWALGPNLGDP